MDTSVVAGRQREQIHQANRVFAPGFRPHHVMQNMTLVALSQLQLISYAAAAELLARHQEAPSPSSPGVPPRLLPASQMTLKSSQFAKFCVVSHVTQ